MWGRIKGVLLQDVGTSTSREKYCTRVEYYTFIAFNYVESERMTEMS